MPAINPRRECSCRTPPLITDRFQEAPVGWGPFVALAVAAAILGVAHLFTGSWGWVGWFFLIAFDALWVLCLWLLVSEARTQARQGLDYVQLDAPSFALGGSMGLRIGSDRDGFAGLSGLDVWLRCVDTFQEERERGDDRGTELVQVCYVVWEDRREIQLAALRANREARVEFALPAQGDFAGPWGTFRERNWEVEVVRHGGASPLQFRVIVSEAK